MKYIDETVARFEFDCVLNSRHPPFLVGLHCYSASMVFKAVNEPAYNRAFHDWLGLERLTITKKEN